GRRGRGEPEGRRPRKRRAPYGMQQGPRPSAREFLLDVRPFARSYALSDVSSFSGSESLMNRSKQSSRRAFLKAGIAAAGVFTIGPRHVVGGRGLVPPSDKVNIALIGAGGQGRSNPRELFHQADAQVIAVAAPAESFSLDAFYYKGAGGRGPVQAEIEKH